MKTLVIVESPSKCSKVRKALGAGYKVESSIGHIRDLPAKRSEIPAKYKEQPWAELGVDIANGFRPLYVVPDDKKAHVKKLKELAREADRVLLATDGDREGEAIAWHVAELLGIKEPVRMVFLELTPKAIKEAAENTRPMDYALVGAQESRRILDRLFGYGLSPVLWRTLAPSLSAGRVQSPALLALAHRETQRLAHFPASYYRVAATLALPTGESLKAQVVAAKGQTLATGKDFDANGYLKDSALLALDKDKADKLVAYLSSRACQVERVEKTPYTSSPRPPFTTSKLQQAASSRLKFSPERTMKAAQKLYESGMITYMRTDSVALSDEALTAARGVAAHLFGPDAVPNTPRVYKTKDKNAQEAHEAIRPAGEAWPAPQETELEDDALALYELIYARTVASQMTDLHGEKTKLHLTCGPVQLEAQARVVTDGGYTKMYALDKEEDKEEDDALLPEVSEGDTLTVAEASAKENHSKPPNRFTEASLVDALERAGLGRPSTYASILGVLKKRGFVVLKKGKMHVTVLGLVLAAYLKEQFQGVITPEFSKQMEADLDRIAHGELKRVDYLTRCWSEMLEPSIKNASDTPPMFVLPNYQDTALSMNQGRVTLNYAGRNMPMPADTVAEDITPEFLEKVLSGKFLSVEPIGQQYSGGKKRRKKRKPTQASA